MSTRQQAVLISLLFFLTFLSMASWQSFLNLYLEDEGYTGLQIGTLNSIMQMMLIGVVPLWGYWADRYGNKRMFMLSCLLTGLLLLGYMHIGRYAWLLAYTFLLAMVVTPLGSLVDSLAVSHVKQRQHLSYGVFRMWGSIGWGLTTLAVGYLLDHYDLWYIFPAGALSMFLIALILVLNLKKQPEPFAGRMNFRHFLPLMRQPSVAGFLVLLFVFGICTAPLNMFINLYFKEIGAPRHLIGLAFSVQSVSEIPLFFFGAWAVKRYGGRSILLLSMLVTLVRLLCYGYFPDPQIALWLGLGQGISLAFFLVAVIDYMHQNIPQQWRATGQALIWAIYIGAGFSAGNFITGFLYDYMGMTGIMRVMSLVAALVSLLTVLFFYRQKKHSATH